MSQKINLQIGNDSDKVSTFGGGEKLLSDDLRELGLDEHADHMRIEFDNETTAKYCLCKAFICSLTTVYLAPFFLFFIPCILYNAKQWANSRKAAVTEKQLVLKQGYYGCFCCCWNERTKSVPLDKITDLQIQQGCIQKCYDLKEIRVETASANQKEPELQLIGLIDAQQVRTMVLKVRDNAEYLSNTTKGAPASNSYNPLLPPNDANQSSTKQLEDLISTQNSTMVEIKDVLQDMKKALISMDNKMGDNNQPFSNE